MRFFKIFIIFRDLKDFKIFKEFLKIFENFDYLLGICLGSLEIFKILRDFYGILWDF